MTIKTIITEPNEILRQVSKPVQSVGNEERKLMDDMLETMYAANGIGLAAIQIGIPKRIIVMDISKRWEKNPMYFVNPKIKNKDKKKQHMKRDVYPSQIILELIDLNIVKLNT